MFRSLHTFLARKSETLEYTHILLQIMRRGPGTFQSLLYGDYPLSFGSRTLQVRYLILHHQGRT